MSGRINSGGRNFQVISGGLSAEETRTPSSTDETVTDQPTASPSGNYQKGTNPSRDLGRIVGPQASAVSRLHGGTSTHAKTLELAMKVLAAAAEIGLTTPPRGARNPQETPEPPVTS